MSIKIIKPGICTTLQDTGRVGYRSSGIGTSGVMDHFAAPIANYVVDNNVEEAVIEMHYPAAEMLFEQDALISICGGNFDAHINNIPVQLYQSHVVQKGTVLSFKKHISGARVYIGVNGGLETGKWLNSYSTHLKVNAGGFNGRVLQKGDVIAIKQAIVKPVVKNFSISAMIINSVYADVNNIHCISGPENNYVDEITLTHSSFLISNQSDRMGYRLKGESIISKETAALISSPVTFGTVQLLPGGQLIILMADHQTTGGYPRIATVAAADLPKLAQLPVNSKIQFTFISLLQAEEMLFSMHQKLAGIRNGCQNFYDKH